MKQILITGGAGFVGSNLAHSLVQDGHKITVIDNLLTGRIQNIERLNRCNSFRFIEHDVIEPLEIDGEYDEIYHLVFCPSSIYNLLFHLSMILFFLYAIGYF